MAYKPTRPFVAAAYPLYAGQIVVSAIWISAHRQVISRTRPMLRLDLLPDGSFGTLVIPGPRPEVLDTMGLSIVTLVLGAALAVHFCWWMARILGNSHALRGKRPMRYGPKAWLWTFVPLAGLVVPILALYEAWTICDPTDDPERESVLPPAPMGGRVPHRLGMWWAVFVVSAILVNLAQFIRGDELIAASLLGGFAHAQQVLAAVLALAVYGMFSRHQDAAAKAVQARSA